MITLEKALLLLENRKKSLIKYVKSNSEEPSKEFKEWVEVLQLAITLIKKEIEVNGKSDS